MGNQTTIIIRNDAIGDIEKNPEQFTKNLLDAIQRVGAGLHPDGVDFPCGHHANVGRVIEVHHADTTVIVASGGSTAYRLGALYGRWRWKDEQDRLQRVINQLQIDLADAKRDGR